jgi:hypothetical protein
VSPTGLWVSGQLGAQPQRSGELSTYPQPLLLLRRWPGRRFVHQGGSVFHDQMGSFSMITALPLMPQVGLFSMIKWTRFRLTKTYRRNSG